MSKGEHTAGKTQFIRKLVLIAKREGPALFIWGAMFAGAMTFCIIVDEPLGIKAAELRWLAFVVSLNKLPGVFAKLRNRRDPFVVFFARAFHEGFLSPATVAPDLSKLVTRMRGFWRNLRRGL